MMQKKKRAARLLFVTAFMLACATLAPVHAKGGAPADPAKKHTIKTIWDYAVELGLTRSQENQIRGAVAEFQKRLVEFRGELNASEEAVQSMIEKDASIPALQAQMRKSAEIQVEMRVADIETARKIDSILTPEQLKKWHEIQRKARSHAAAK